MIRFYKKTVLYSVLCLTIARALTHLVRLQSLAPSTVTRIVQLYRLYVTSPLSPVYKVGALFRATAQSPPLSFPIPPPPNFTQASAAPLTAPAAFPSQHYFLSRARC